MAAVVQSPITKNMMKSSQPVPELLFIVAVFLTKLAILRESLCYLEDIDIGYRARIYGYYNMYCPTALVYHVGSGTSGSKYNAFKVKLAARNNLYLNYKNMPILQLIINFIPLAIGYFIKYLFFCKIGFGKEYKEGFTEGLKTAKNQKKVKFQFKHLGNYFIIEIDLFRHTFAYIKDWFSRKLLKK